MRLYISKDESRDLMSLLEERIMILAGWGEHADRLEKLYQKIIECNYKQRCGIAYEKRNNRR